MATLPTLAFAAPLTDSDDVRLQFTAATTETLSRSLTDGFNDAVYQGHKVNEGSGTPTGIYVSDDGLHMYQCNFSDERIYQYDMSTAWDVTSATFITTIYIGDVFLDPRGITFSPDGMRFYVVSFNADKVFQFSMTTAWDFRDGFTNTGNTLDVLAEDTAMLDLQFKPDGTKLILSGNATDSLHEYTLSTAWDITTATHTAVQSIAPTVTSPVGFGIVSSGDRMYLSNYTVDNKTYELVLSTPWDITTVSYTGRSLTFINPIRSGQDGLSSLSVKPDGTRLFGHRSVEWYQWDIPPTGTPSDLASVDTASWTAEYRQQGRVDDILGLSIRIMSGATVLAAADSAGTFQTVNADVQNTTDTTQGPTAFSYVNTAASKAAWDAATVELQQTYSVVGGSDSALLEADFVALDGTYTTHLKDLGSSSNTVNTASGELSAPKRLSPDVIITQTNLSGVVGDIQDSPNYPDANWLTAVDPSLNTVMRASFPSPGGDDLAAGADVQRFDVLVRTTDVNATAALEVQLYESGALVSSLLAGQAVTSETGVKYSATFDAATLADITGAGVEIRMVGTADVGGSGNALPTMSPSSGSMSTSNDVRLAFTAGTDAQVISAALSDTPVDLGAMDTMTWTAEYLQVNRVDDTLALSIRIMSGATVLAAADSAGTFQTVNADVQNTTDVTTGPTAFAYVNTAATKAQWDAATVELQQGYSQNKGGDGAYIEVDYVEVNGTYTSSANSTIEIGAVEWIAPFEQITRAISLDGTASSATGAAGEVFVAAAFDGSGGAVVQASATLNVVRSLASSSTAASDIDAALDKLVSFAGVSAGVSNAVGDVVYIKAFTGVSGAASFVAGNLSVDVVLVGSSHSASYLLGTLDVIRQVVAVASSASSSFGDVTYAELFYADANIAADATSTLSVTRFLTATVSATVHATGYATYTEELAGNSNVAAFGSASLHVYVAFAASSNDASGSSSALDVIRQVAAVTSTASSASGDVAQIELFVGATNATSGASADFAVQFALDADVDAATDAAAAVRFATSAQRTRTFYERYRDTGWEDWR